MIIHVKELEVGYLINGNKVVLPSETDLYYKNVLRWIAVGNPVEPKDSEAVTLAKAKVTKLKEIENDFLAAENTPVVHLGVTYIGGMESALSIDSYIRLRKLDGAVVFYIWDINGVEYAHTEESAMDVVKAIGTQASINKFTKKNRKVLVRDALTLLDLKDI